MRPSSSSSWITSSPSSSSLSLASSHGLSLPSIPYAVDYMAPEVLRCPLKSRMEENKDNEFLSYTTAVDVWAVGVLAYELLTGILPFTKGSDLSVAASLGPVAHAAAAAAAAAAQHLHPQLQPAAGLLAAPGGSGSGSGSGGGKRQGFPLMALSFPASVPEDARDFILKALDIDPDARPTIRDMSLHGWMRRHGPFAANSISQPLEQQEQQQQQQVQQMQVQQVQVQQ
ncbi:hypothetical protein Vafri_9589 [Volvox africanus]|uniref:Protein kinase domain-containing protein n=1 Tax=Volvox africanus TaxID=51714 RepID=A0A8J4B575_9CHLO|nr:hypothetical protein Vafri_9589 [Volvox africanus]